MNADYRKIATDFFQPGALFEADHPIDICKAEGSSEVVTVFGGEKFFVLEGPDFFVQKTETDYLCAGDNCYSIKVLTQRGELFKVQCLLELKLDSRFIRITQKSKGKFNGTL